jgi:hypothetical protein
MIIVLKDADFSANNIGKIEVSRELDVKTKQLLSRYSKVLDTSKQYAVDDFVTGLYSSGLSDKITFLLLPCLASSIDEAMINAMNGDSMGQLNSNYWLLRNNGLAQTSSTYDTIEAITRISAYANVPINNNHYAVYNTEEYQYIDSLDTSKQFPSRRNASTTFYDNCAGNTAGYVWINSGNYGGVPFANGHQMKTKCLHQIVLSGNDFSVRNSTDEKNVTQGASDVPSTYIDDISICGNGNNGIAAHGFYSFGFALTDEEQKEYARLVESLMNVLLA